MPRGARAAPPGRDRGRPRVDARGRRARSSRPTPSRPRRLKLDEWGLGDHTHEINVKAAADRAQERPARTRFVAGSIGPTGFLPASDDPTLGNITFGALVDVFAEQARGLIEGGADVLIIETAQDILEVKAAIFGAREAFDATGRTRADPGTVSLCPTAADAARHRHRRRADDARGARRRRDRAQLLDRPEHMREPIRFLGEHSPDPVSLHPERRPAAQGPTARRLPLEARAAGRRCSASSSSASASAIVGGCCGTTPEHIRAIAERVTDRVRRRRARRRVRRTSPR